MDEIELHLELQRDETKTPRRQMTEGMLNPAISNAEACMRFMQPGWTGAGLTEAMEVLSERTKAVNAGDMRDMEGTLVAQTAALNSIFIELTRRAHLNIGQNLDVTDRYLRLAFKAQSQCRATVESLALIKNPRVYAKQANINAVPVFLINGELLTGAVPFKDFKQRIEAALARAPRRRTA